MKDLNEILNRLEQGSRLAEDDFCQLLESLNPHISSRLRTRAAQVRDQIYGRVIFIRGLVEFTNYCKNNCFYCGIRRDNTQVSRYRLTKDEILACCSHGYDLGFRTFVLQGGEDPYMTDDRIVDLASSIKSRWPDCALTLSIGERPKESYQRFRQAGADRYLLRHETADPEHYRLLHPAQMSLQHRMNCLRELKDLGFQTGAGMMVGTPGQTSRTLAKDLMFLQELQPQMVGIGPFLPHHQTPFAKEPAGDVELTLDLLAITRLILPHVLLPATTALGSAQEDGRERGILSGANVVMPNLSPQDVRAKYSLYDNKRSLGSEAAEGLELLRRSMASIGFEVAVDRGDYRA